MTGLRRGGPPAGVSVRNAQRPSAHRLPAFPAHQHPRQGPDRGRGCRGRRGLRGSSGRCTTCSFSGSENGPSFPPTRCLQVLSGYAQELGLDVERFNRDLQEHTFQARVMGQYQEAVTMGLPGTPSFIVNGRMYPTDQWGISYQGLSALIGLALLEPRLYSAPPALQIDPARQYVATIRTPKGDIAIELYAAQAPLNVNSFIFLARQGWYDGTTFFRVIPNFVVQAGDPTGTAAGTPGFQCDDEIGDLKFDAGGSRGHRQRWSQHGQQPVLHHTGPPARSGRALHDYREGSEGAGDSPGAAGAEPGQSNRPAGAGD
jgi:peptidyl-prolyl cis-trans isomerase B (cyclophilin B)